jgi:next-to-BRCA1 protein 1
MQRTIDDLVTASEWDPMLEELEEMGFYDMEMNRRLMFKNKGSVKRVVKELVQMYKDPSISGKEQV